jgi:hypothetical protein
MEELSRLDNNLIGDAGAIKLGDAVRVNATLEVLE